MPRPVHFEIGADNVERATNFYTSVFNWEITKWDGAMPYWMVKTGEQGTMGIDGGIFDRAAQQGSTINTIDVPSVDEYLGRVTTNGGSVVMPKSAIPGVGYFAYCMDTENNVFGIMQGDPSAAA